jgi:5-hydroxyisourate hydrolase-like protein (transthyretin family)
VLHRASSTKTKDQKQGPTGLLGNRHQQPEDYTVVSINIGGRQKLALAALMAGVVVAAQAARGGQDWGPMPYPTPVNEPTIRDFTLAAQMIDKVSGDPAYAAKLATYRMCSELALRALVPYKVDTVGSMIYTAVRGCTRQMDDYVLLFVQDERFKANYYVAHAVQRLAQQEQQIDLLPLAERLRAPTFTVEAPGLLTSIKKFFNIGQQQTREEKT